MQAQGGPALLPKRPERDGGIKARVIKVSRASHHITQCDDGIGKLSVSMLAPSYVSIGCLRNVWWEESIRFVEIGGTNH